MRKQRAELVEQEKQHACGRKGECLRSEWICGKAEPLEVQRITTAPPFYALLTCPPLETPLPVRLACVKHATSVNPELGSNSP
ncbi:hypothetical protein FH972_010543 [Carpinus fangiana]|uniref:Uncharacterized protein n=1 Tax=Carpinus fangiana TaxID=176857 RepID=A0A660KRT0_9ROSI|nr:hypothetical protein FH972_010543 [Carpinus fangiana]